MKIVGIFRGFPGLGRVVSGIELLHFFKRKYKAEILIFTYFQGGKLLKSLNGFNNPTIYPSDISSIGIIPVSIYGESILNCISTNRPDFVLIDGEPLMVQAIKLTYPTTKVVSLLNPSDVENSSNQYSSQLFFNHYYSLSDLVIVHGLRKIDNPGVYRNYYSINTIIRKEIMEINPKRKKNEITCILGGGTVNVLDEFLQSTIQIANLCIELAKQLKDHNITILCSSNNILESLNTNKTLSNITNLQIISEIKRPFEFYSNSALIITRAGRNSLSELLYLKLPTISFISGCYYRKEEQTINMYHSKNDIIKNLPIDIELPQFIKACKELLSKENRSENKPNFQPGNKEAIEIIIGQLNIGI